MPYADFEPRSADAELDSRNLSDAGAGASVMDRVQRRAALLEDVEQRQARIAQEMLPGDQAIQQNRQRLAAWEGEARLRDARARAAVAELDTRYASAIAGERTMEEAAGALPGVLRQMQAESDPAEIERLAAEYHDRFGRMENLPEYASRIAPLAAQVGAVLQSRRTAFAARVRAAADALAREIDPADPEKLARLRRSPAFSLARRDPRFAAQYDAAHVAAVRAAGSAPTPVRPAAAARTDAPAAETARLPAAAPAPASTATRSPGGFAGKTFVSLEELAARAAQTAAESRRRIDPGGAAAGEKAAAFLPAPPELLGTRDYYLFRDKHASADFKHSVGPNYYIDYGLKYFDAFQRLKERAGKGRPELVRFIDGTARELQVALERVLDETPTLETSREKLRKAAFATHASAYKAGGAGELDFDDLLLVAWTAREGMRDYPVDSVQQMVESRDWIYRALWDDVEEYLETMGSDASMAGHIRKPPPR